MNELKLWMLGPTDTRHSCWYRPEATAKIFIFAMDEEGARRAAQSIGGPETAGGQESTWLDEATTTCVEFPFHEGAASIQSAEAFATVTVPPIRDRARGYEVERGDETTTYDVGHMVFDLVTLVRDSKYWTQRELVMQIESTWNAQEIS